MFAIFEMIAPYVGAAVMVVGFFPRRSRWMP